MTVEERTKAFFIFKKTVHLQQLKKMQHSKLRVCERGTICQ